MLKVIFDNYLLFHSIVELASVVTAFSIMVIYINSYRISGSNYFAFLGFGFGFVGLFDFLHTLAYKGMGVFPGDTSNLATQFWISARFLECFAILVSSLVIYNRLKVKLFVYVYSLITAAILVSIFCWNLFPDCYVEGVGLTPFKIIGEYVISFILLVSLVILYSKREQIHPRVKWVIIAGFALVIVSEVLFTSYHSVYSFTNVLGHIFKLASLMLIYRAFVTINFKEPMKLIFRELELKKKTYETLFLNNINMTCILDPKGKITDMNRAFREKLEYNGELHDDMLIFSNLPEEELDKNQTAFKKACGGEAQHYETVMVKRNGNRVELDMLSIPVVINGELHCVINMCKDITVQKEFEKTLQEANARLQEINSIDGLTGIKNRAYFDSTLVYEWDKAKQKAGSISMIMSDIDNFKAFNDTYGHLAGDECLKQVAKTQVETVKKYSLFVSRYGGEEFVVILPGVCLRDAYVIAEAMRNNVEALQIPHSGSKAGRFVTISVGACSVNPDDSSVPGDLINKADKSLYRAKQEGRNRVCSCSEAHC